MMIGWWVGRNKEWSNSGVHQEHEKQEKITDRRCTGHILLSQLFVIYHFTLGGGPPKTQARMAHLPVVPHTFGTASIWQQALSAGRWAVCSTPRSTNTLPMFSPLGLQNASLVLLKQTCCNCLLSPGVSVTNNPSVGYSCLWWCRSNILTTCQGESKTYLLNISTLVLCSC